VRKTGSEKRQTTKLACHLQSMQARQHAEGGGRRTGGMLEPPQSPTHSPSLHPTDTNSNSVVVHTDRKTEDRYI
jgi:hypothetical protein